jgi:hypothetical protein
MSPSRLAHEETTDATHSRRMISSAYIFALSALLSLSAVAAAGAESNHQANVVPISVCATCSTLPFGINDHDQVTGLFFDAAARGRGFLKTGEHYDVIDIPGAQLVEAQRANNAGYVVGDYLRSGRHWSALRTAAERITRSAARIPRCNVHRRHLSARGRPDYRLCDQGPRPVGRLLRLFLDGTNYSEPFSYPAPDVVSTFLVSVNHRDEWVGPVELGTIQNEHGFYRSPSGEFRLIDFPGSIQSEVFDITDDGLMLGRYMDVNHINHGFFLDHGVFTSFDYVGPQTYIWKINHRGVVVGYSFESNAYAPPAQGFMIRPKSH